MRIKSLIVAFLVGLGLAIGFSGERPVAAAESINGIATIQYQPGYGIALWSGISGRFTGRYLAHGSQWRVLAREQRDKPGINSGGISGSMVSTPIFKHAVKFSFWA